MSAESPAYWAIRIFSDQPTVEYCLPEWYDLGVESFMEETEALLAYVPEGRWDEKLEVSIAQILKGRGLSWEKEWIAPRNWNAVWESGFDPVRIPDWCLVRAEFHPSEPGYPHEIIIRPQMAFGTGHHETTYMMLEWLRDVSPAGKRVLDYGCGTGILAILAAMLGARDVVGVDIEAPAIENAKLHTELNAVGGIHWIEGELKDCPDGPYDLILANINKNVLVSTVGSIHKRSAPGGHLLLSGILMEDREIITERYRSAGFDLLEIRQKGNWLSIHFSS